MSDIGPCLHIQRLVWGAFFGMFWTLIFFSFEIKHEILTHGTNIQCLFDLYFYLLLILMSRSGTVSRQNDTLHLAA